MSTPQEENVISGQQMCKVLNLFIQHGVTQEILQERLLETGILSDLANSAVQGTLPDREKFQQFLFSSEVVSTGPLLEFLGAITVPATASTFIAKEKFVVNTTRTAPVKIISLSYNFKSWFLSGSGKTEEPESVQKLYYRKLRQSSVDGPIIAKLGGEGKAETTLSELYALLERQRNRKDGPLLTDGGWNVLYIKDTSGVLRAVRVLWHGSGGWYVNAFSIEDPNWWSGGGHVFSRGIL